MNLLESFIIGLVQGLTEFLPVSSSAHIKLAKILFGLESAEGTVLFDLTCHLGTLSAVLFFFRREIFQLFTINRKQLSLLFVATLPLIPFYFLLKPLREFASTPELLGFCLILTSCILFVGDQWRVKKERSLSLKGDIYDVLWIGTLQATALIPGISRSASTISCARVLGWKASDAVRFSFLLSIPTVIGGNCLELLKMYSAETSTIPLPFSICAIGFFTAMGMGLFMIRMAISFLQKGNLKPFAWYCLVLGVFATFYLNTR